MYAKFVSLEIISINLFKKQTNHFFLCTATHASYDHDGIIFHAEPNLPHVDDKQ